MMKPLYDVEFNETENIPETEPFKWTKFKTEELRHHGGADTEESGSVKEDYHKAKTWEEDEEERRILLESILQERLEQVEQHLEKTKRESEIIHNRARKKGYDEGRQAGYGAGFNKGFEEGKNEGYADYRQKIEELESRLESFIHDAEIEKQKLLEKHLEDLKEIALVIGEKIVRTSLRANSDVIKRMIIASTEKLKKSAWAKIYIDSSDGGFSIQSDAGFLKELSYLSDHIKIVVMDGMEPGTCIIERPDEIIDISVGTQLENIREIMNNGRI